MSVGRRRELIEPDHPGLSITRQCELVSISRSSDYGPAQGEPAENLDRPGIFNTDQGSQFTSPRFTGLLTAAGIRVSMDGRGRWMDNVFIERLWRSMKHECVHLHAFETGSEARTGIGRWIEYHNTERPHSALADRTPDEAYQGTPDRIRVAA